MIGKKLTVMLVEDELHTRELIEEYIQSNKSLELFKTAKDGAEALGYLKKYKFDLLFLDIGLPFITGIELIKKMSHDRPYVIFITALREHAVDAFELGAVDYVVKPISEDRFNQAVDRAIKFIIGDKKGAEALSENDSGEKNMTRILQEKFGLTQQQASIAAYLKDGYTRSQVCEYFDISQGTLKNHLLAIYQKTVNIGENEDGREGRADKLSKLILFLSKL